MTEPRDESSIRSALYVLWAMAADEPSHNLADEAVRRRDWGRALGSLSSGFALPLLAEWWRAGCLTAEELRTELPSAWSRSEPNDTSPKWLQLWREAAGSGGRIEEEPLPTGDPLTVYRGEAKAPRRKTRGIAWTLSPDVAIRFALRLPWSDGSGVVLEGVVPRDAVLGYITDRNEQEVIVQTKYLTVVGMTTVTTADRPDRKTPRPTPVKGAR